MVGQTSLLSYVKLKAEGKLGEKQKAVMEYISTHPASSDREIAVGTKLTINCVCGRRNELMKMGLIEAHKKYDHVTERFVQAWMMVGA